MSILKSRVGPWSFSWKTIPHGREGTAQIQVERANQGRSEDRGLTILGEPKIFTVHWKQDRDGLWLSLPQGLFGFDISSERDENSGQKIFTLAQRNSARRWNRVASSYGETDISSVTTKNQTKTVRVKSQMPGKVIRIMVKEGDKVTKDQPLLVMEAMKMENEIRSPQVGHIAHIRVTVGQAVETGVELVTLGPGHSTGELPASSGADSVAGSAE